MMGKIIAILALVVLAFMGALVVPLALSGKLDMASINTILGREAEEVMAKVDPAGPLMQSLNDEQERLKVWAEQLTKREELLTLREADISSTLVEVKTIQDEITESMNQLDSEQETALTTLAKTLSGMKADNAAASLEQMTPEQASVLLPMITEKSRGKILDAMKDIQHRALIFQIMQETKY